MTPPGFAYDAENVEISPVYTSKRPRREDGTARNQGSRHTSPGVAGGLVVPAVPAIPVILVVPTPPVSVIIPRVVTPVVAPVIIARVVAAVVVPPVVVAVIPGIIIGAIIPPVILIDPDFLEAGIESAIIIAIVVAIVVHQDDPWLAAELLIPAEVAPPIVPPQDLDPDLAGAIAVVAIVPVPVRIAAGRIDPDVTTDGTASADPDVGTDALGVGGGGGPKRQEKRRTHAEITRTHKTSRRTYQNR
jgi:hypothetical protein